MSVVNNGYHLRKTGERVNELLSRQFIVPTLLTAPTSATLKWEDGEYDVYFRVGEMCRTRQDDEWVFYRLDDIANGKAFWSNANASELPDMGNYYTKNEVDDKIKEHQPDLSEYYTAEEVDEKLGEKANSTDLPNMSEYYTKEEADQKIEESVSSIVIPEDESIKNVTEDEYNAMFDANELSDKTMYFVSKDGSPIALYIGRVQIAVREEGSKGFAYNFPIIF
jgi:hypothetical protein